ncbi:MAG: hypothetical protein DI598_19390, partial [Pseudopedobacter saltans]
LNQAFSKLKYRNAYIVLPPDIETLGELNRSVEYYPKDFKALVEKFNKAYSELPTLINNTKSLNDSEKEVLMKEIFY